MKQNDVILIIIILLIAGILLLNFKERKIGNTAKVYYENDLILTIDLNIDSEYDVKGYNGNVHIIVKDKKIKVDEENSPKHLCSKQGFISYSYETIVCLPNKILIKIEDQNEIDTIIG